MRPPRRRLLASAVALALVAGLWTYLRWLPSVAPVGPDLRPALARAVLPIATDDPEAAVTDLQPLLPLIGSARVVALGEATHGTREFFRLKDRLFRFLVREAGFTTVALEISPQSGSRMDDYVQHGTGTARAALDAFEFWTWKTEEVLALVEWIRGWNVANPARRVTFAGINATGPERDRLMATNVERVLRESGGHGRVVVWAHNAHVASDTGRMGRYLRDSLGNALYIVGFEFSSGTFRSRSLRAMRTYTVGAADDGYYAADLARHPAPILFLDFRRAVPAVSDWLGSARRSRDIDEFFYVTRFSERWHSRVDRWADLYDAVLFVRQTTAAKGL